MKLLCLLLHEPSITVELQKYSNSTDCHIKEIVHASDALCLGCRGENILLFLVQTVGRQLVEQRQYRPTRMRSSRKAPVSDLGRWH